MSDVSRSKQQPLDAAISDKVRERVNRIGLERTSELTGVSRQTLTRILAGLPCYRVTHYALKYWALTAQ